jgi:hypothetical protein
MSEPKELPKQQKVPITPNAVEPTDSALTDEDLAVVSGGLRPTDTATSPTVPVCVTRLP